jgi:hypothetical protein
MCAELIEAVLSDDSHIDCVQIARRARALLDQPVAEEPTDEELVNFRNRATADCCASRSNNGANLLSGDDLVACQAAGLRAVLAKWGNSQGILDSSRQSAPEGAHFTDGDYNREIHYAWELEDAEGEWQAGGSANRLDDVRREGSHYLQTYSQDGPHKLIIQRHCLSTIEEDCEV